MISVAKDIEYQLLLMHFKDQRDLCKNYAACNFVIADTILDISNYWRFHVVPYLSDYTDMNNEFMRYEL